MTRYGMVIDLARCVSCYGCVGACKAENATPKGVFWASARESESGKYPNVQRHYLPLLCMHCEDAPCVSVCPTGASVKRADGIVAIDYEKCIGCKYCIVACPYGARTYMERIEGYFPEKGLTIWETRGYTRHKQGVVEKCTFCVHRVQWGLAKGLKPGVDRDATPACVNACIGRARFFGDLDDPTSKPAQLIAQNRATQLRAELGTEPSVYYIAPARAVRKA